jgi:hypothetical protein
MINNPAAASLLGIGSFDAGAGFDASDGPAPAQNPAQAGDAIATGANAAGGLTLLETALSGISPAAHVAVAGATAAVEATLRQVLADLGGSREAALLAQPAVVRTLAELAVQQSSSAALSAGTAATLVSLASLLRGTAVAASPAESALALERLTSFLTERSPDVATAAAALQTPAASPTASNVAVPLWDPALRANRADEAAEKRRAAALPNAAFAPSVESLVPERDARGRLYDAAQRARLAALGVDPRRGFAPEARAALAVEDALGLRFGRAPDPRHDFIDEDGAAWDVVAPAGVPGLERTVRQLAREANVILSGDQLAPESRAAARALLARLAAAPGMRRLAGAGLEDD